MQGIDAILMGRNTFEKVLSFGIPWPFEKPVFVWSTTLHELPTELLDKVSLVKGSVHEVLDNINKQGYTSLYIDGGKTIQSLLSENLIHEITITTIPVLIGEGIPLFSGKKGLLKFQCINTKLYSNGVVQSVYGKLY
jgi:dihydrofolate reductase